MRHVLTLLLTAAVLMTSTLKSEMEYLHQVFGVNFVYDSSIDLDVPYKGPSMKSLTDPSDRHPRPDRESLEEALKTLFADTGIEYEIMKKYIVLTKAGSRKPKDYTIFIEEQRDTLDESRITAYIDRRRNTTQTGLQKIDGSRFRRGYAVLGSPDLIKELQSLPGVSGGTEQTTFFFLTASRSIRSVIWPDLYRHSTRK